MRKETTTYLPNLNIFVSKVVLFMRLISSNLTIRNKNTSVLNLFLLEFFFFQHKQWGVCEDRARPNQTGRHCCLPNKVLIYVVLFWFGLLFVYKYWREISNIGWSGLYYNFRDIWKMISYIRWSCVYCIFGVYEKWFLEGKSKQYKVRRELGLGQGSIIRSLTLRSLAQLQPDFL